MIRCPICGSSRVKGEWVAARWLGDCNACGFEFDATDEKNKEV